jgi:hypothetical protein
MRRKIFRSQLRESPAAFKIGCYTLSFLEKDSLARELILGEKKTVPQLL